jgi:periplasmic divalent cation tolerance protein
MSVEVLIALCTCPTSALAEDIAEALVGEGLAACVNILPGVTSVYRWQGALHRDSEFLILVKTTRARLPELTDRIRTLHTYDLPEVVALPVTGGLPDYLNWVIQCTSPDA